MQGAPGTRAASSGASAGAARRSSHPAPAVTPAAETSAPTTPAVATARAAPARLAAGAVLRLEHVPGVVALRGVERPSPGEVRLLSHQRDRGGTAEQSYSDERDRCRHVHVATSSSWPSDAGLGAHALGDRCTHERYTDGMGEKLTGRASPSGTPHSAAAIRRSYSLSGTRGSSTIHVGTAAHRDPLVVDKMRHALARALAVPALWVSTVTFPIMALAYCLAIVALDSIERAVRRGRHR